MQKRSRWRRVAVVAWLVLLFLDWRWAIFVWAVPAMTIWTAMLWWLFGLFVVQAVQLIWESLRYWLGRDS